ncbi:MAG: hypothetical protein ACI8Z5_000466 [Lentimonas sp.]
MPVYLRSQVHPRTIDSKFPPRGDLPFFLLFSLRWLSPISFGGEVFTLFFVSRLPSLSFGFKLIYFLKITFVEIHWLSPILVHPAKIQIASNLHISLGQGRSWRRRHSLSILFRASDRLWFNF